MALMYEKGTLSFMSEIQSGTSKSGNQWSNQTIVLDIPGFQGTFRKLALKVSGREVEDVQEFHVGEQVEVGYQVSAREYNGRWYNDVALYNIKSVGERQEQSPAPASFAPADLDPATHDDLPFD